MKIKLWSINRWLRYTGFRLFVEVPTSGEGPGTSIGIAWHGLPGSPGWHRIEGTVPAGVFTGWVGTRGLSDEELDEKLADEIDSWHTRDDGDWREMHEFLGLSWHEYRAWAEGTYKLSAILSLRGEA